MKDLVLKKASEADIDFLFESRNRPDVVRLGRCQKKVTRTEHESWFHRALERTTILIFIAYLGRKRIGQVRFDMADDEASVISIFLIREYIGLGLGRVAIKKSCNLIKIEKPVVKYIFAEIREDNIRSLRAFKSVGFDSSDKNILINNNELDVITLVLNLWAAIGQTDKT